MKKKRKKQRRECVCVCVMGLLLVLTVGSYCLISWVCPGYGLAAKQEKAGESTGGPVDNGPVDDGRVITRGGPAKIPNQKRKK